MKEFRVEYYHTTISRWSHLAYFNAVSRAQARLLFMAEYGVNMFIWHVKEA